METPKKSQDPLEQQHLRTDMYRNLFESASEGYAIIDKTGFILHSNPALRALLGQTSLDAPIGLHHLFQPLHAVESLLDALASQSSFRCEGELARTGNASVPVDLHLHTPTTPDAGLVRIRDLTEKRESLQREKALASALQEKNEELENVVYITSHDLRSPLLNIKGFGNELLHSSSELLDLMKSLEGGESTRRIKEILAEEIPSCVNYIGNGIRKMDALLSGLLLLSRIGRMPYHPESLEMTQLLEGITQTMEYQIRRQMASVSIDELPSCTGDRVQITQIFSNLVENALKYRSPLRTPEIRIRGRRVSQGESVYSISDNGIGIHESHFSKIFAMFYRLNPREGEGEGIGLPAVLRYLQRNQGRIWVESRLGEGTTFHVALPTT